MHHPTYVLLYVDSPAASARFYGDLLGLEPVESSPTFALFVLDTGVKLGLWSRHAVVPAAGAVGGSEIGIKLEQDAQVDGVHADWVRRGVRILTPPQVLEFGRNFVALDPDGHRLRVFALSENPA